MLCLMKPNKKRHQRIDQDNFVDWLAFCWVACKNGVGMRSNTCWPFVFENVGKLSVWVIEENEEMAAAVLSDEKMGHGNTKRREAFHETQKCRTSRLSNGIDHPCTKSRPIDWEGWSVRALQMFIRFCFFSEGWNLEALLHELWEGWSVRVL